MSVEKRKSVPKREPTADRVAEEVVSTADRTQTQTQTPSIYKKVLTRMALSVAILSMVYLSTKNNTNEELVMASASQSISGSPKGQEVMCSQDYKSDRVQFPTCAPHRCGRFVSDAVVSEREAQQLLSLAKRGLSLGGSSGGASILDLHSGALSLNTEFVNIYKLIKKQQKENIFTEKDFEVYKAVKNKIVETISFHFGVSSQHLYLTDPTFFSRITSAEAQTVHDQYWHKHVDKEQYKSFHFTSLLYLGTYGKDFFGGRFIFLDKALNKSIVIEPKVGRLSAFTSGSENEHFVEKVTSGTRYAITISFTCDPKHAITDPIVPKAKN